MDNALQRIREFIEGSLVVLEDDVVVDDDDNIFELGFVDSLFALQLITFIEETFEVKIDNEDLDISNFRSVSAVAQFVDRKKNNEASQ